MATGAQELPLRGELARVSETEEGRNGREWLVEGAVKAPLKGGALERTYFQPVTSAARLIRLACGEPPSP